jgi:hypothetical protein
LLRSRSDVSCIRHRIESRICEISVPGLAATVRTRAAISPLNGAASRGSIASAASTLDSNDSTGLRLRRANDNSDNRFSSGVNRYSVSSPQISGDAETA